jgi:transcriptional regulator with GAF, ATPase, and Fis domain
VKHSRFYISLYIIFPFIFTGFTILAAIVSFRLTKYGMMHGLEPARPVFWFILVISCLAYVCGFALVRLILKPVEKFVAEASKFPSFGASKKSKNKEWSVDKIQQFTNVFDQVTSVLSHMDARHFFPDIIGESRAIRGLLGLIKKVAPTDSTVLILGESGTGKELVASSIHANSEREDKTFIKLNCAAIPEELLESELFGHEKGAFTGATKFKPGKFDMANGGTLFLDEIGDMTIAVQVKLLRVLEEGEFTRLGGTDTLNADVRLIVATNKNLVNLVRDREFRDDLFYRINVFPIQLPALRQRPRDILSLARHFLRDLSERTGKLVTEIEPEARRAMLQSEWPGNVRELKNVLERAVILTQGTSIGLEHLPARLQQGHGAAVSAPFRLPAGGLDMEDLERMLLLQALEQAQQNKSEAARLLGMSRATLRYRLRKYGLEAA